MHLENPTNLSLTRAFILLLIGVLAACITNSPFPFERAMKLGAAAYSQGNYELAETHYSQASEVAESNGDTGGLVTALGYLGRTYSALAKVDEAEKVFKRRIEIGDRNLLDSEKRLESRTALAIFYSQRRNCESLKSVQKELNDNTDTELRSSPEYDSSVELVSDLDQSHCSGG